MHRYDDESALNAVHFARAGPTVLGEPHHYRLQIRMDVGGFQTVDVEDNTFFAGEAVELTNDGRVVRVSGTTLDGLFGKKK